MVETRIFISCVVLLKEMRCCNVVLLYKKMKLIKHLSMVIFRYQDINDLTVYMVATEKPFEIQFKSSIGMASQRFTCADKHVTSSNAYIFLFVQERRIVKPT